MRASGSAYQPWMTGLPGLSLVMSRGCWEAVAVIAVRKSIASRKYMMRVMVDGRGKKTQGDGCNYNGDGEARSME